VGTYAVQIAKAFGANVTGVCSTKKVEMVRSIGADHVIDYTRDDFAAPASDARYDVVVDCVGNAPFERVAPVIRPGGALLLVIADLRGMLAAGRQARRSGIRVDHRGGEMGGDGMARLAALAKSGALRPVIDRTFALDDVVEAHRYVDTGRKRGSVVLTLS
jgi:NADPH:quinone reductase-like Zn-dependent oxidoreductase